ncbi:DUF115 domain-containing protein [Mesorhizobium sp. RP14(2022)]|uniref:DUF115 domain-containing protein n=1 Tax=Mesorhizobium liriopis TaxID=2953882 RepID=A0ABT1C5Q8_9HYPH|nr:6-hydroxymethylpterin diphosphokinase MptE-like protein [Mesorhizobium liriopis]MCO6050159.1 DUF115 domain-containing protein [Mesorhizobium liriopis]
MQSEALQQRLDRILLETGYTGAAGRAFSRVLFSLSEQLDRAASAVVCALPPRLLTRSADRQLLKRNRELFGRHAGQRCFILGNGPSLLKEDVGLLSDEICITVNQGHRFTERAGLQPRYHAVVDPIHISDEYNHLFKEWAALERDCGTTLLLSTQIADRFAALGQPTAHYAVKQYLISTYFDRNNRMVPIDLHYVQPGYVSVIHFSIVAALYMGFSEICLLGCDMDFFIRPEAPFSHSYDEASVCPKSSADLFGWDQVDLMAWALVEYRAFRQLGRLAESRGARIVNSSAYGALNVYPRKLLRDIASDLKVST